MSPVLWLSIVVLAEVRWVLYPTPPGETKVNLQSFSGPVKEKNLSLKKHCTPGVRGVCNCKRVPLQYHLCQRRRQCCNVEHFVFARDFFDIKAACDATTANSWQWSCTFRVYRWFMSPRSTSSQTALWYRYLWREWVSDVITPPRPSYIISSQSHATDNQHHWSHAKDSISDMIAHHRWLICGPTFLFGK